ncbi:signal peptide peptidase-domain-containing protein [Xylaria nigripes]|nr:signal peptide peptidase-domain-containing protein [Xylaria nigripes]
MAAENSTALLLDDVSLSNITTIVASNQTFFDKLASVPTALSQHTDLLALEVRIVLTSLACIYIGSHGALRRPPSAKLPPKDKTKKDGVEVEERDDKHVQGLLPSDAIMFPILAGTVLIGLYYLIKWLESPDILNKIMRYYFSFMSLASLKKLFSDGFQLIIGFIFPTVWMASNGTLYHIDSKKRGQWYTKPGTEDQIWDEEKRSPMPSLLSDVRLPDRLTTLLWQIRRLALEQWTVRLALYGLIDDKIKVNLSDIVGVLAAIGANVFYYKNASVSLSNIMGYAFSYAGIFIMSPTTFVTGSMVLFGLFFYDIVMVFYTPYMVTVATKLDAPVKLVFEGPQRASMLGLGDIVIPGMFVALCLRFDHYMYYYRQQKLKEVELETDDASSGQLVTTKESQRMVVKPEYVNPKGQWGDRFWGTKLSKLFSPDATPAVKASAFPKPYFYAAMVGYLLAMVATLVMLITFRHAQPALLYLVPGVVSAVWATGAVRGEVREMWKYTEDGSLDKTDVIVEIDGEGNVIKEVQNEKDADKDKDGDEKDKEKNKDKDEKNDTQKKKDSADEEEASEKKADMPGDKTPAAQKNETRRYVFLLSIEGPSHD